MIGGEDEGAGAGTLSPDYGLPEREAGGVKDETLEKSATNGRSLQRMAKTWSQDSGIDDNNQVYVKIRRS